MLQEKQEKIDSLVRKGVVVDVWAKKIKIPRIKGLGCVILGNRSWGKVHALQREGYSWHYFNTEKNITGLSLEQDEPIIKKAKRRKVYEQER